MCSACGSAKNEGAGVQLDYVEKAYLTEMAYSHLLPLIPGSTEQTSEYHAERDTKPKNHRDADVEG